MLQICLLQLQSNYCGALKKPQSIYYITAECAYSRKKFTHAGLNNIKSYYWKIKMISLAINIIVTIKSIVLHWIYKSGIKPDLFYIK